VTLPLDPYRPSSERSQPRRHRARASSPPAPAAAQRTHRSTLALAASERSNHRQHRMPPPLPPACWYSTAASWCPSVLALTSQQTHAGGAETQSRQSRKLTERQWLPYPSASRRARRQSVSQPASQLHSTQWSYLEAIAPPTRWRGRRNNRSCRPCVASAAATAGRCALGAAGAQRRRARARGAQLGG
jgi:hypothetical protein